jgi:chemotaxis protein MotB
MDSLSVKLALFLPEQLELESENGNLHVSFTNMIFFASNKSRLSMSGKSTLADLAFVLKNQESEFDIQVIGHADPRKINSEKHEDNWALSMKRALAVVRELEKHHVNSARITASAKSYFDPYHNGKYDLGMKADRRVEIVFIPKFEHEVYNILFGLK